MSLSSQTLSAPGSPALLGATPTWDPRINPNPEWLHLDGVPGMEHLVEAAAARFGPALGGLMGTLAVSQERPLALLAQTRALRLARRLGASHTATRHHGWRPCH